MTDRTEVAAQAPDAPAPATRGRGADAMERWGLAPVALLLAAAVFLRPYLSDLLTDPAVANWATMFVAVTVQALPFVVLGVAISAAIAAFVPPGAISRWLSERPAYAVPVAAVAGAALPGCECGSVPVARRLMSRGVAPAAALTFLLSAPAINPIVIVATAVAFPGRPEMVAARFGASLLAAIAVGLVWASFGRPDLLPRLRTAAPGGDADAGGNRVMVYAATARHDLLSAGGYLVIGAATAATLQTAVPRRIVDAFAGNEAVAILALAVLAVLLAICSEADAFVAAGLTQFSLTARLAFLVVGPMVDVKLVALQAGTFGRRFALRFAPLTFVCAVLSSVLVGWWVL